MRNNQNNKVNFSIQNQPTKCVQLHINAKYLPILYKASAWA